MQCGYALAQARRMLTVAARHRYHHQHDPDQQPPAPASSCRRCCRCRRRFPRFPESGPQSHWCRLSGSKLFLVRTPVGWREDDCTRNGGILPDRVRGPSGFVRVCRSCAAFIDALALDVSTRLHREYCRRVMRRKRAFQP